MSTKLSVLVLVCVCAAAFLACGDNNALPTTTSPANAFAGSWSLVFKGDLTGRTTISIRAEDGYFSAPVKFKADHTPLDRRITGWVQISGQVRDGSVYEGTQHIGVLNGNFTGNAGNGTISMIKGGWLIVNGTWTASRQ